MNKRAFLASVVPVFLLAAAPFARAEKLEGIVWDVGEHFVVEGVEVVLTESTRIERKGHPGITPVELRIGWEVEVQGRVDGDRFLAEKL